jgi:uncharacterized protein
MRGTPKNEAAALSGGLHSGGRWKFVWIYYGIACLFSWIVWIPLMLGQDGLKLWRIAPPLPVFACIGTLGPLIGCYLAHRLETGNWHAVRLLPAGRRRGLWFLLGPLLILFCFFVIFPSLLSSGDPRSWKWNFGVLTGILVPMLNYNLLGGPLFEEFGWRGFLLSKLQAMMPPWAAAIGVGIMWTVWHWPLFIVHFVSAPPIVFALIEVGVSMIMALPFNASGRAVTVAILMHSAFNASSRFVGPFLGDTPIRSSPSAEVLLAISFLSLGIIIALVTKGRMAAGE